MDNEELALLTQIAEVESYPCDTAEVRKLWYKGLVRYVSLTNVQVSGLGLKYLYRAEEAKQI